MFSVNAPVAPAVSLTMESSVAASASGAVDPPLAPSAFGAVDPSVAPSAFGAVDPSVAPSAFGAVDPSVAPSVSASVEPCEATSAFGAVDPLVAASASDAVNSLVATSASGAVEPPEATTVFGAVNPPVTTSTCVAVVGPLVATSASVAVAVDPLAAMRASAASNASVAVLSGPPVAMLAILASDTSSDVTATPLGAPAIISPSDKPIVGSAAVPAARPDFLVPSVPVPKAALRSVSKAAAAEQQAVLPLKLRPSQWLCGPQHHLAEPAVKTSAASMAEVAAVSAASSIFMSEAATAPMAVSTCKTKSTSDRVAEAMAATVAKKSKDPWPYVSDYFSFIGLRSNNEPCYQCCLCRHKRVKVNAHLSTLYNLKSHVKRRHPGWSEAFREAIQEGRRIRRREKLR
jgi:hypothetical protein